MRREEEAERGAGNADGWWIIHLDAMGDDV
jgi:hypothetical protein